LILDKFVHRISSIGNDISLTFQRVQEILNWMSYAMTSSPKIQVVPARPELGRAQAFLNGSWSGTNKSWAVPCPPDGLVARPRHGTSPVKRVTPARAIGSCRPTCPTRKRFKPLKIFIFYSKIPEFVSRK
jgi:hypothetical protein